MPIRKNRFPRRPVFAMDSSEEEDDDVAAAAAAYAPAPMGNEGMAAAEERTGDFPMDLSVKPDGNGDHRGYRPRINEINGRFVLGNGDHDEDDEDDEGDNLGPPSLGEPYLRMPSPLELKFLHEQQPEEDSDEPQDLSVRPSHRPPALYNSSPSSSSPSSSSPSSLFSLSSHDGIGAVNGRYGGGGGVFPMPGNGNGHHRPTSRYASDPHLRHHKRERLEEMVNHIRRHSNQATTPPTPNYHHHHHHHHRISQLNLEAGRRSNSCSSLRSHPYPHPHYGGGGMPAGGGGGAPSSHERLLACLAKPPLKSPIETVTRASLMAEAGLEAEGVWRPEDIFLLPATNGDLLHKDEQQQQEQQQHARHKYPPPHVSQLPPDYLLQRFMSSSLTSLMSAMPPNESISRHFHNASPNYLPLLAYNYYAQLMQLSQFGGGAAANGGSNGHAPHPLGKVLKSPQSPTTTTTTTAAATVLPTSAPTASVEKTFSPTATTYFNPTANDSKSDSTALLSPPSLSPNGLSATEVPRKRAPRALTGKHVKHGTGASPSTLLTLRQKIEQRQRIRQVVDDFRPPAKGRIPASKRKHNSS